MKNILLSLRFVAADNPEYTCGETNTFFNWGCSGDDAIMDLIMSIFNWLSVGVATVVIVFIVLGAIQYMTASGNQDKAKKAIQTIINAVIALFLYFAMWAFLNYLVPGGLFATPS